MIDKDALAARLARIKEKYDVRWENVQANGSRLKFLQLADEDRFIERLVENHRSGQPLELPYWIKIWPANMVLARVVAAEAASGMELLEIGAGIGVAGLFAAAAGARVTVSDIEPDALDFIEAEILANGLESAQAQRLDYTTDPPPKRRWDCIIGSEVIYKKEHIAPLAGFLETALAPGGKALLAGKVNPLLKEFMDLAETSFACRVKSFTLRGRGPLTDDHRIFLFEMTRKNQQEQ